jgi:hypothetical protein
VAEKSGKATSYRVPWAIRPGRWVASPVLGLLFASGPPAIVRLIVAVIVLALDRMAWTRTLAHISKEVCKREPRFAHRYAAATIPFKVRCSRIGAAVNHGLPAAVLAGFCFSVEFVAFTLKTAAALATAVSKCLRGNLSNSAAHAYTATVGAPTVFANGVISNSPQTKNLPKKWRKVMRLCSICHSANYTVGAHCGG